MGLTRVIGMEYSGNLILLKNSNNFIIGKLEARFLIVNEF